MPEQTVEDLGKLVKQKYPGSYDSMPDADVGRKVKAKYPQYAQFKDISGSSGEPPKKQEPGMLKKAAQFGGDVLAGIGAEAIGTGIGALKFADKLTGVPTPEKGNPVYSPGAKALSTPPATAGGTTGSMIERTAELLLPGGAEEKLVSMAPKGLKLIARAAAAAVTTAAASKLHGEDASAPAATAAGLTLLGGALTPAIAAAGRKIQASTIRPRNLDKIDGFKWETLDKFKLKGNLEQSLNQVESELGKLRQARNAKIAPGTANVNLDTVFNDALQEVTAQSKDLKFGGMGKKAIEQVQNMKQDLIELLKNQQGRLNVDISKAENLKEFLGTLGSWSYGRGDPDAKVTELVANTLYSKVRQAIETSLGPQGPEVKALNKQMQELIPVKNAMLARLPVEERNRLFSLADIAAMLPAVATGDARLLALEGLTRAQKSLRFGNWLVRNAADTGKASKTVGKLAGGAVSAASPGSNALPAPQ